MRCFVSPILVGLNICLANDAAIFVILLSKQSSERCAAQSNRVETLSDKLRPDLGDLHCRSKPAGELRNCLLGRLRWREHAIPELDLPIRIVAKLVNIILL